MKSYFYIEPEVAGGWGANTVVDTSCHPPHVSKLNYEFSGWIGDDLLESFPCYIVTERLQKDLIKTGLTGFFFDEVEISKSEEFMDVFGDKHLPNFAWLKIVGDAGKDDFGIADDYRLVISDAAYNLLRSHQLNNATVEPY